jgi:hypothetical protein
VQARLDEKPENHLSPGMWLTMNPVRIIHLMFHINLHSNTDLIMNIKATSRRPSREKLSK